MHIHTHVCVCVYVCTCARARVCVCVLSSRWRRGGHEVAGEDSNFGGIHAKVAHFCRWKELYAYEPHAEPAMQLPISDGCRFCRGSDPNTIKTSNSLPRWTSTRPHHPTTTPPGVPRAGSQTGPPLQSLVTTVAGRLGAPRQPVLWPWRPAAAHPRVFRRGPGLPTLMTVFWPTPFMGKVTGGGGVCVCVCMNVRIYVCSYTHTLYRNT